MPIYEYKCRKCGDVYEVKQSFSEAPLATHESCGGEVERLISAPAIQFKGSGWYITDYARKSSSNGKNGSKAEGSAGETKSDAKAESKSDSGAKASSTSDKK
jgi:putative FmdB family regulatory protein